MFSIHEVYKKWERSPVIVNFANRGTPIYKIPFPAVTICPESKTVGEAQFNFTRLLLKKQQNLLTPEEKNTFQYMSLICQFNPNMNYMGNATLSDEFLDVMDNLDYACKGPVQGYRVSLHAPTDVPRLRHEYFRVPLDHSVVGAIQPVMITTSPSIKKYSPKKRGCYFQEERYLRYFKIYTSANCKLECLTNLTLDNLGCVNFYMPRENGTKICGADNIRNMEEKDNMFASIGPSLCQCLPRCSDLSYEVVTSASGIEGNNWLSTSANMSNEYVSISLSCNYLNFILQIRRFYYVRKKRILWTYRLFGEFRRTSGIIYRIFSTLFDGNFVFPVNSDLVQQTLAWKMGRRAK
ncbi:ASC domain containing protein [Asbolus verrucosus]|uniref:ASC domain containing protein n=1 Tax=Asbolus verrucosus TaxID=1661398 RepID=A0A482VSQ7_ASBVE|nr:ASC domain containing protein [Asbolus verrucosus]